MVREAKILRATTKKISRHFLRKHVPQSERFRFVFSRLQVIEVSIRRPMAAKSLLSFCLAKH
ncbi:DUF1661 domain-containing protein [Porphyromonas gingivalis]|uniref:DUF1661 domain-containing protein n=1 Tax=Porphyromonas gingivalis TaxID=837 RepID=UPI003526E52D